MRTFLPVLPCVFGVVALVANAGTSAPLPAAGPARSINACELISAKDVAGVVQLPVRDGARRDLGPQASGAYSSTCIWFIGSSAEASSASSSQPVRQHFVILNVMRWPGDGRQARSFLDEFRKAAARGDIAAKIEP